MENKNERLALVSAFNLYSRIFALRFLFLTGPFTTHCDSSLLVQFYQPPLIISPQLQCETEEDGAVPLNFIFAGE